MNIYYSKRCAVACFVDNSSAQNDLYKNIEEMDLCILSQDLY